MGLLGRALAGSVAGAGEGMQSVGERKANAAIEKARQLREDNLARIRAAQQQGMRIDLAETERGWRKEDADTAFKHEKEIAAEKGKYDLAEKKLSMTQPDKTFVSDDGYQYVITKGNEIVNTGVKAQDKSGKAGSSDKITLKSGQTADLDDLRKAYEATYGEDNGMGMGQNRPTFAQWVNEQAEAPVFQSDSYIPPEIMMQAEDMARKWADRQAGYLSTDKSDFDQYGGSRESAISAKTQEFARQLMGNPAIPDRSGATAQSSGTIDIYALARRLNNGDETAVDEFKRLPFEQREKILDLFRPAMEKKTPEQKEPEPQSMQSSPPSGRPVYQEPVRHEANFNIFGGLLGKDEEYQQKVREAQRRSEENKRRLGMQ